MNTLLKPLGFLLIVASLFSTGCQDSNKNETSQENSIDSSDLVIKDSITISGRVVKITDGDTFDLLDENQNQIKIRLEGIDAPENKQAYSNRSKQTLSDFIFNKVVEVKYKSNSKGKDRYGRILATVYVDSIFVNAEMIRSGMAWHYKKYSKREDYSLAEIEAREKKNGLWKDDQPTPPWDYRDKKD